MVHAIADIVAASAVGSQARCALPATTLERRWTRIEGMSIATGQTS
jgi:hypothetical protein